MFYSVEKKGPLPYLLSVPQAGHGPFPVLCFLHGYDEGPPTPVEEALTRHGPFRPGKAVAVLDRFIVVAPQMPVRGDLWRRYGTDVSQIVRETRQRHGGEPRRTFLTGFSFGGNGVFDLALTLPDEWAALWSVDPTRIPERDPGLPVWLSVGILARRHKDGFALALELREYEVEHSAGDRVILDEGLDHVGCATAAYRDERIYRWLLAR